MKMRFVRIFGYCVIIFSIVLLIISFTLKKELENYFWILLANNLFWLMLGIALVSLDTRLQNIEKNNDMRVVEKIDGTTKEKVKKNISELSIEEIDEEIKKTELNLKK